MFSCSEPYTPTFIDSDGQTVIIAELEVGKEVSLSISSTYGPNSEEIKPRFEDGPVILSNEDNGQPSKAMRFISKSSAWIQTSFKFFAGQEISMTTDFSGIGLSPTVASCIVPDKGGLKESVPTSLNSPEDLSFDLDFTLEEIPADQFYHIIPVAVYRGIQYKLDISNVKAGANSSFVLSHTDGILIDYSSLDAAKNIQFTVSTSEFSDSNLSNIFLIMRTAPEAYYHFHTSLSNQAETQQSPFDAPVQTYTNIEGGQGIFVAYQTVVDSIAVQ